jgi:hypothetical protein
MSVLLAFVIVFVTPACVAVDAATFTFKHDNRAIIEFGAFGFNEAGVSTVTFKQPLQIALPSLDPAAPVLPADLPMGFALDLVNSAETARGEREYAKSEGTCFVKDLQLTPKTRYTFFLNGTRFATSALAVEAFPITPDTVPTAPPLVSAEGGRSLLIYESFTARISRPGLYALFFFNCVGGRISGAINVEQYNVDAGGSVNYLSVGDQPLPAVFAVLAGGFAGIAYLMITAIRRYPTLTQHIHRLMLLLVVVKSCTLLLESLKYAHHARAGEASLVDFLFYVFMTLRGVMLFAVIVLLGVGWSTAKSFLSENDKTLLMVILPLQVVINVALAVLEESSEALSWWGKLLDVLRLADLLCCLAVILPLMWSMRSLQEAAHLDEKAVRSLARLRTFRAFYFVVVVYIYTTRIILVVVDSGLSFKYTWVGHLLREIVAGAFYFYMVYTFRPEPEVLVYEGVSGATEAAEMSERQELA